jgi:type I restriction enzyme, R subunit
MLVTPKLHDAGWTGDQIQEQLSFTDGRVVPGKKKSRRLKQKRPDYRLVGLSDW